MKRPDNDVIFAFAIVARQHRELLTFLQEWRQEELEALPYASGNAALMQGRSQVLKELVELITKAPDTVADPRWQQRTTHTDRSVNNG